MGLVERALVGAAAIGLGAKALLLAHAGYSLGLVGGAALFGKRQGPTPSPTTTTPNIAVLVVAHDEETVIERCVTSLLAQRYPGDRFRVIVAADNCSDRTAAIARAAGAMVLERRSAGARGKPAALDWALDELARVCPAADAVAIFDADNVVAPNFLDAVATRLGAGERVVQGAVDAKNPNQTWVSAASALGFIAIDALAQRPREQLGLSAGLMGTGWVATRDVLDQHMRGARAVTDDLEAGALLALAGIRVAYEADARLLDEKPTQLGVAVQQRERWMRGRIQVVLSRVPALLCAALDGGPHALGRRERLRALDVAVQLAGPSLAFSSVTLGALAGSEVLLGPLLPRRAARLLGVLPAAAALGVAAAGFLAPATSLLRQRASRRVWLAYMLEPAYLLLSIPLAAWGFRGRNRSDWRRTRHGEPAARGP